MTAVVQVSVRHFSPTFSIQQLRSSRVADFGAGNMTAFKRMVDVLAKAGVKSVCVQPIHEVSPQVASPFSRTSMNALSHRLLDLMEIPEIKNNWSSRELVRKGLERARLKLPSRKTDLAHVEKSHGRYLERAYRSFKVLPGDHERVRAFDLFCEAQGWWLDAYAYFKVLEEEFPRIPMEQWDSEYADMKSRKAQQFLVRHQERIDYYRYVQMETYRQVREALQYAHANGIEEIEVLVGVGITAKSAEGFLMPDCFDRTRQIGCFPEPENGYPIQLWGFLAERSGEALLDFKARSFQNLQALGVTRVGIDHACGFLGGYTTFPVYDPYALARGVYRVLNAGDKEDAQIAEAGGRWAFQPGSEEAARLEHARAVLKALLTRAPGMQLTAETVGDNHRRTAAETAIRESIARGEDITLMRALPWENTPLSEYTAADRLSLTHDMPALVGLLTGRAGDHVYPWINGSFVSRFLRRLGVLAVGLEGPIDPEQLTVAFMVELHRRIIADSHAGTVVMPLASLFTLGSQFLDSGAWQYTNIQPGTSGEVGNATGNWEQRLPEVEALLSHLGAIQLATDTFHPYFSQVPVPTSLQPVDSDIEASSSFQAFFSQMRDHSLVYQAANSQWTVWEASDAIQPLWEIAVSYQGGRVIRGYEGKAWIHYDVSEMGFALNQDYMFYDLVSGEHHLRNGTMLLDKGLAIGLNTTTARHHFVVYQRET